MKKTSEGERKTLEGESPLLKEGATRQSRY